MSDKTLGQICREAYLSSRKSHDGLAQVPWAELPDVAKQDWESAAKAVLDAQPSVVAALRDRDEARAAYGKLISEHEKLKQEVKDAEAVQAQYHGVLERVWQCGTAHWPDKLFDDVKKLLNNGSL